jgi:hypothetical protein
MAKLRKTIMSFIFMVIDKNQSTLTYQRHQNSPF